MLISNNSKGELAITFSEAAIPLVGSKEYVACFAGQG